MTEINLNEEIIINKSYEECILKKHSEEEYEFQYSSSIPEATTSITIKGDDAKRLVDEVKVLLFGVTIS